MIKRLCLFPGCQCFRIDNSNYCERHQEYGKQKEQKRTAFLFAKRSNEELYHTAEWKQLRKQKLTETPFCEICGISKEYTILEIHHKIPPRGNPELFYSFQNLMCVCKSCHQKITADEIRERKNN